jgi:APA family basic amino acid/polyamine antiporter
MLVVASMVGTGVFTTTGFLLNGIRSTAAVLVAWLVGGVVAMFGSLAYAELVAALPENGGEYQLLSRIYHRSIGFVAGFVSFVVGFTAPIAASAIAFGKYANAALEVSVPEWAWGSGLVVVLSVIHSGRVGAGGSFQNVLTAGKVALILVFITGGIFAGQFGLLAEGAARPMTEAVISPAFAVGLIFVSFAYTGWNAAAYVAGEVERPARNLPRALVGGTAIVTALYVGLNAVFLAAAPRRTLAAAGEEVAHVAAVGLFGESAGRLLSAMIALGLISTVGALIVTGPRVYEAIGRDYARLRFLRTRRADGGPVYAIGLQAALAIVLLMTSSFGWLLQYIGFTLSLFAALTVAGVFVLRVREPDLARPYRTWGHPVTTLLFIALMGWMVGHEVFVHPLVVVGGAGTIAAGILAYLMVAKSSSPD